MVKYFLSLVMILLFSSCSIQQKVERQFEGEGREEVLKAFGEPQKVVNLDGGKQQFVYVKETFIRETEISTGDFTLDKRVSPSFVKEETYRFVIDQLGIVRDVFYEKKTK
jgi:outer membrane protein assembly factor BamE (lipoprotein component of BamABCDE complex)